MNKNLIMVMEVDFDEGVDVADEELDVMLEQNLNSAIEVGLLDFDEHMIDAYTFSVNIIKDTKLSVHLEVSFEENGKEADNSSLTKQLECNVESAIGIGLLDFDSYQIESYSFEVK